MLTLPLSILRFFEPKFAVFHVAEEEESSHFLCTFRQVFAFFPVSTRQLTERSGTKCWTLVGKYLKEKWRNQRTTQTVQEGA